MNLEEIVQRILLVRRDLTREGVLRRIYEKKRSAGGYFLDEVAARIVASELGVEIPRKEAEATSTQLTIDRLVSGLNDVTITGRVIIVYPVQTFSRPDFTEGKVARLLIADKTGTIKTVLWNSKAHLAENRKITSGQIIRVLHGYMREGLDGTLELHVGERGDIQISPQDVVEKEHPSLSDFVEKIGEITGKRKKANVLGVVQRVYPISEFKRADGSYGKVRRLRLRDETGEITLVFWNQKVNELGAIKKGDCLRIMNARVRELAGGFTELHVENATQIDKIAEKPLTVLALPKITKIRELKPQMRYVNVLARVIDVREAKEFKRPSGEFGRVSSIHIQDETDTIQLNLWNEKATLSQKVKVGDIVLVEGAYTRYKFGKLELNLGKKGQLTLNPSLTGVEQLPPLKLGKRKKISEITGAEGPLTIEATILTTPILREVTTSKREKVKVASFDVTDGTGRINVSFWRKFAELAGKLSPGTRVLLKNVYAKRGFADQLELTTRVSTKVEILSHSELSKRKTAN